MKLFATTKIKVTFVPFQQWSDDDWKIGLHQQCLCLRDMSVKRVSEN